MTDPATLDVPFWGGPVAGRTLTVPVDETGQPIRVVEVPTMFGPKWIGRAFYDLGQQQAATGPAWVYRYRWAD